MTGKCPECGKAHRSKRVAARCMAPLDSLWSHYVLICYGLPGGVCEDNVERYDEYNSEYFREVRDRRDRMKKYMEGIL